MFTWFLAILLPIVTIWKVYKGDIRMVYFLLPILAVRFRLLSLKRTIVFRIRSFRQKFVRSLVYFTPVKILLFIVWLILAWTSLKTPTWYSILLRTFLASLLVNKIWIWLKLLPFSPWTYKTITWKNIKNKTKPIQFTLKRVKLFLTFSVALTTLIPTFTTAFNYTTLS